MGEQKDFGQVQINVKGVQELPLPKVPLLYRGEMDRHSAPGGSWWQPCVDIPLRQCLWLLLLITASGPPPPTLQLLAAQGMGPRGGVPVPLSSVLMGF